MTYRGHVKNGVIVLDVPVQLPEGAQVTVYPMDIAAESGAPPEATAHPAATKPQSQTLAEVLKDFIGKAEGFPADSSINHDHYLYGAPKK